jgi:hypothetical protein
MVLPSNFLRLQGLWIDFNKGSNPGKSVQSRRFNVGINTINSHFRLATLCTKEQANFSSQTLIYSAMKNLAQFCFRNKNFRWETSSGEDQYLENGCWSCLRGMSVLEIEYIAAQGSRVALVNPATGVPWRQLSAGHSQAVSGDL